MTLSMLFHKMIIKRLQFSLVLVVCISFAAADCAAQASASSPAQTPPAATEESGVCAQAKANLARLEVRLRDWPALSRYRDENAKLVGAVKSKIRVVFLGDSITDGWQNPSNGGFFPGKPFVNRGISGQTTPQMLIRFRPDVIALKPQAVVILAGTNDIAGNTGPMSLQSVEDNLASITELARAHGIRVVLSSVLPVSDYEKTADGQIRNQTTRRPPEQIKALNEWMKHYATENKVTYLDYYSAMADEKGFLKDELSNDGLHPNLQGYQVMNPLAEKAIAAALKRKH